MNLSLSCGHSYCRDCPESLLGRSMWLAALQTDFKNLKRRQSLAAESCGENQIESGFPALWCTAWKRTMWCVRCKGAESLQILSGLPLLLNVRLVSLQIPMRVFSSVLIYSVHEKKNVFLLRPGDFLSHWSDIHEPSVLHTCQENTKSLWMWTNSMITVKCSVELHCSFTKWISQHLSRSFPACSDGFGPCASGIRAPSSGVRCKMIRLCNWQKYFHI